MKKKSLMMGALLVIVLAVGVFFIRGMDLQGKLSGIIRKPDLTVSDLSVNAADELVVSLSNIGEGDVSPLVKGVLAIYIDDLESAKYNYDWKTLSDLSFLKAGGSSEMSPQTLSEGVHGVKACIDSTSQVTEKSETNNCSTNVLTVGNVLAGDDDNDPIEDGMSDGDAAITGRTDEVLDGGASIEITFDYDSMDDEDCLLLDESYSAGVLSEYDYVTFFLNPSETDITYDSLGIMVDTDNACSSGTSEVILGDNYSNVTANGSTLSSGTDIIGGGTPDQWVMVTVPMSLFDSTILANATYFGFSVNNGTTDWAATDQLRIDGVYFHN
jgi:CARDB